VLPDLNALEADASGMTGALPNRIITMQGLSKNDRRLIS
jgi:hypothetical protein